MLHLEVLVLSLGLYIASCHRVRRIVGGDPAELPPEDDPVVFVRFAGHSAKITGVREFPHYVFRGVRYAHAPKGKDRFQRPRQFFLKGEVNATEFAPPCLQPVPGEDRVIGDEDCLFLNIFTPNVPDGTEGLPVVVWIHGGGFRYGSASQYGVRHLVGKRLVVVTIQYRLGSLGFLSIANKQMPGNAGIWDMRLAVQFVRNYIGFFGGNPHKIVVMGHGSGASSALLMGLSNVAKGMTSGIVAMSGTAASHGAIDNKPVSRAQEIAEMQGCPTVNLITMIKCLKSIPGENIIKSDSELEKRRLQSNGFTNGLGGASSTAPAVEGIHDGRCLPPMIEEEPMHQMQYRRLPKVPLLTGVMKDETKRAVHSQYRNEILSKLNAMPQFLNEILIKNLQNLTGLIHEGKQRANSSGLLSLGLLDLSRFQNYLTVKTGELGEMLDKISEATGDALFNLPAFLTAELWSKSGAPAYMYRFEHSGRAKKANAFLRGLPIVGNLTKNDGSDLPGHGDDLAYIFEARHMNGTPQHDDESLTKDDSKVREVFTQMISDFARHGKIHLNDEEVPAFSGGSNAFVQISPTPKVGSNFRFCEMALWAGLTQRLQMPICQAISSIRAIPSVLLNKTMVESVAGGVGKGVLNKLPLTMSGNKGRNPFGFF